MNKKEIYIINPGGNITAIVRKKVTKNKKISLERVIKKKYPKVEQVGFWSDSNNKNVVAKLEMVDGELCVNAIRSLAYLIYKERKMLNFFIEIPAIKKNIKIEIYKGYPKIYVPTSIISIKKNTVFFPTISYIIIKQKKISLEKINNYFIKESTKNKRCAMGYISYTKKEDIIKIKPFVWIRNKKTFIAETGCGSGSMAVARFLKNISVQKIKQPSQSIYIVNKDKNYISIYGKIKIEC